MFFTEVELDCSAEMETAINKNVLRLLTKFNEGYQTGVKWPDKWKTHGAPGGPWVYGGNSREDAEQSLLENEVWRNGYREGRALNP